MVLAAIGMVGCGQRPAVSSDQLTPQAAPTLSSVFVKPPSPAPRPTREAVATIAIPIPTTDATVVTQATNSAIAETELQVVPVYADALTAGWSVKQSFQMGVNVKDDEYIYKGDYALKAQPLVTTGVLYFTLDKTAKQTFLREQVQGLRFYLSGGDDLVDNEAITVAVIGSNAQPYWVNGDTSVKVEGRVTEEQPLFSETRLSFLGINTSIPPKTYAEVTVWLDDLIYDPPYTYVTGFYLKTDKEITPIFYVDQVSLLLLPDR